MQKKSILIGLIATVVIAASATFLYYYAPFTSGPEDTPRLSVSEKLRKENAYFMRGSELLLSGDETEKEKAGELFEQSLRYVKTPFEEALVKYYLAFTKLESDPARAIGIFKEIAANPTYPSGIKAYSVQQMGLLFYFLNSSEVTRLIATDEPYQSFFKEGDILLGYRRLFEYASSFKPLAISESYSSMWYVDKMLKYSKLKTLTPAQEADFELMKTTVKTRIENANEDIAATRNTDAAVFIPLALAKNATHIGFLYRVGDKSYGDPEKYFKEAILEGSISKGGDGLARYAYAYFLAEVYGKERVADITSQLAVLYQNEDTYPGFSYLFNNERQNIVGIKTEMILMASLSPDFKTYLKSKGWTDEDFK